MSGTIKPTRAEAKEAFDRSWEIEHGAQMSEEITAAWRDSMQPMIELTKKWLPSEPPLDEYELRELAWKFAADGNGDLSLAIDTIQHSKGSHLKHVSGIERGGLTWCLLRAWEDATLDFLLTMKSEEFDPQDYVLAEGLSVGYATANLCFMAAFVTDEAIARVAEIGCHPADSVRTRWDIRRNAAWEKEAAQIEFAPEGDQPDW